MRKLQDVSSNFATFISGGILCLLFLFQGCQSAAYAKQQNLANQTDTASVPPPQYTPGTKFIYSDGSWDKVVSVNGSDINWINHRGYKSQGSNEIIYKRSIWKNRKRNGVRSFSPAVYLFSKSPDTLWPLQTGKRLQYYEEGQWWDRGGYTRSYKNYWTCKVATRQQVSVAAGAFDSWKIECNRYSSHDSSITSTPYETRIYHYAPSVGHWIKMEKEYPRTVRPQKDIELVAVLPDLKISTMGSTTVKAIKKQFQKSLERNQSGQKSFWKSNQSETRLSMMPISTYRTTDGTVCRQYQQSLQTPAFDREYFGIACRNQDGQWKIPRKQ